MLAKENTVFHLVKKGVYSNETRILVRILSQVGVSNLNVMKVIQSVLDTAGIKPIGNMSARTVARIIEEGYYASKVQLGFEMDNAKSITFSSDGTGHKNLNYNSRHANYKVVDKDGKEIQVTRFVGLERSLDGTSKEAIKDWDTQLQGIVDIFNNSPLAQEQNKFGQLVLK